MRFDGRISDKGGGPSDESNVRPHCSGGRSWCLSSAKIAAWLLVLDKHAELHGSFGPFHSAEQIEEVNAIIGTYTPDEFAAAVALAKSRRL